MAQKTPEEIAKMSDEELLAAAAAGELGAVDGSNPTQRSNEDEDAAAADAAVAAAASAEEEEEEGAESEEEEQEEEGDEEEEEEEEEEDTVKVGDKTYTKDEYAALIEALETDNRAVPQSRLQEEANKRREAEQNARDLELRLAKLAGAQEAEDRSRKAAAAAAEAALPKFDLKAKRREYLKLVDDGKLDEAAAIDEEIEAERSRLTAAQVEAARKAATEETKAEVARVEFKSAVESVTGKMYTKYPFLDSTNAKERDETAIYAVVALRDSMIREGKNPIEALRDACTKIGDAELKKRPAAGKKPLSKDAKKKADELRAAAIAKGAKTALAQPARPGGIGNRLKDGKLSVKDINKMSDEEIAKLTPAEMSLIDGTNASQRARA